MKDRKTLTQETAALDAKVRDLQTKLAALAETQGAAASEGIAASKVERSDKHSATPQIAVAKFAEPEESTAPSTLTMASRAGATKDELIAELARTRATRVDLSEVLKTQSAPKATPKTGPTAGKVTGAKDAKVPQPELPQPPKIEAPRPTRKTRSRPFADALASLDPDVPLVLFPVRLEVRFRGAELLLRIYPDEILADSHEPELTATERKAAARFWVAAQDPDLGPRGAWRELLLSVGPERAAWIARVTDPSGPVPVGSREGTWTRAVQAWLLPDSWRIRVVRYPYDTDVGTDRAYESLPVDRPLALTLTPPPRMTPPPRPGRGVEPPLFDDGSLWTVDFERARQVGMAVRIPLQGMESAHNFDGVVFDRIFVTGVYSDQTPAEGALALARLFDAQHYTRGLAFVRQGTPTNNTTGKPAGYPPPSDPDVSFEIERLPPDFAPDADGAVAARTLGIDPAVFHHVAGQARREQRAAEDMNRVLWPATIGYFLTQMLEPQPGRVVFDELQKHFIAHVRGRGALPVMRVGAVPYGFLVASSIRQWIPTGEREIDKILPAQIQNIRRALGARLRTPHVGGLPRVGRSPNDPDRDLLEILGGDSRLRELRVRPAMSVESTIAMLTAQQLPSGAIDRVRAGFAEQASRRTSNWGPVDDLIFGLFAGRFVGALVGRGASSEARPSEREDARAYLSALANASLEMLREGVAPFRDDAPLLYTLVRHAAIWELSSIIDQRTSVPRPHRDAERIDATGATPGIWQRISDAVLGVSLDAALPEYAPWREAVLRLAATPRAELERLLTETLDVCSHRIDAWESSLYHQRLADMRRLRPEGCHIGAWGVLEDVRRRHPLDGQTAGYIHAPSLDHAATAAVLMNAHRTYQGEQAERFRIDLSSRRVRGALAVLEAVRAGQRFEDALARAAEHDTERAQHIRDALGDLFTAEAVFQIVRGNAATAGASLDALARGTRPPELEVVRSARGGAAVTHRVLLALPVGRPSARGWRGDATPRALLAPALDAWVGDVLGDPARVRCVAKYADPSGRSVLQELSLADLDLRPLDVLALAVQRPPGFARNVSPDPDTFSTELEVRLARALPAGARSVVFNFHAGDGMHFPALFEVARSIEAFFGTARSLRGTDLTLPDHAPPPGTASREVLDGSLSEVIKALTQVYADLRAPNVAPLQKLPALFEALLFDLPEALVLAHTPTADELRVVIERTATRILDRFTQAAWPVGTEPAPPTGMSDAVRYQMALGATQQRSLSAAAEVVEALFGRRRLQLVQLSAIVPRSDRDRSPTELRRPLAPTVASIDLCNWMQSMWRVRAPFEAWRRVALYEGALGTTRTNATVLQLEPAPYGVWAGARLGRDGGEFVQPPSGCVSLVRLSPYEVGPGPWCGLLVDEWTEIIPNERELTGVAFHYDDPGAEAPQAVLVAVPPVRGERWTEARLFGVIEDTVELAQVRTMDASVLGDLGRVLPALYLAVNAPGDTVSTTFSNLEADPPEPPPGAPL